MAQLTYYVKTDRYGSRNEIQNGQTFGTWGATVCVILLLTKANGHLFCGHMSCGYTGVPGNKDTVKTKVKERLDSVLGDDNKGQAFWLAGSSTGDNTNKWMREAMKEWFTNDPTEDEAKTDGYFRRQDGVNNVVLATNITGGTTEVDSGDFEISPD